MLFTEQEHVRVLNKLVIKLNKMIQPKVIKLKSRVDPLLKDYPEGNIKCILQERNEDDDSEIVYIPNLKFKKGGTDINTRSPYIALTIDDYEVVEWSK